MTLREFRNELQRLHCIDGDMVPELPPHRAAAFVSNPVQFFLRADDATQRAIWNAMQADAQAWADRS